MDYSESVCPNCKKDFEQKPITVGEFIHHMSGECKKPKPTLRNLYGLLAKH